MKNLFLLTVFLGILVCGFSQKLNTVPNHQNHFLNHSSGTTVYSHDIALIKPLINTNDSNGGYYSEYYFYNFNFLYCGGVIKNTGIYSTTHVYLELKTLDYNSSVLQTFYSDTLAALNPGEEATVNIPGELIFQSPLNDITHLLFTVKSDSIDDNPANNQDLVPFTTFFYYDWTFASRSVTATKSYDIGQSGIFHSGDFLGFTLSIPNGEHMLAYSSIYLSEPWPDSLGMTAMIFRNGHLVDTAIVDLSYTAAGWIGSNMFNGLGWDPVIMADSSYVIGFKFNFKPGQSFKIGTDTSSYHNFAVETKALIGGTWTTLDFVPLMELVCDPEGISERDKTGSVRVFPNPARGTLFLENVRDSKLELFDLTGRLVFTDDRRTSSRNLDISSFAPGIYMMRITTDTKICCRKIVVK